MGEIDKTQSISWYEGMRLMDAIADSGGFKRIRVKTDQLYLWRNDVRHVINIKSFFEGDSNSNVKLQRGDLIILQRNLFAKIADVVSTILSPVTNVFSGAFGLVAATNVIR